MTLSGCGNKTQAVDEDSQDDLFVEYHEYYFPQKIETLALGELAGYRGRLESPFPAKKKAKQRRASRNYGTLTLPSNLPETRRQLLRAAESAIGTPYVLGGMAPGGFDCSGLVCWAYGNVGVRLPRTAREQSVVGSRVGRLEDMQAGDIVTFRHPKRGYHSGIYVGNGKFIHSPRTRSRVKINSLDDPYFRNTFLSARRIHIGSRENLLAQAERRLVQDAGTAPSVAHREDSRTSRNASRYRRSSLSRSKQESTRSNRKITVAERRERKSSSVRDREDFRSDRSRKRDREDVRSERSRKREREDVRSERSRKREREDLRAERSRKREDFRKERPSKRESRDMKKESRRSGESLGRKEDRPSSKRSRDEKKSKKK
ncbi:MAG: C40 family peptidase [Desulfovibrionaceae bacterium]|nr:C40 family peptidase [Desulfovibrionaceae bacterium]